MKKYWVNDNQEAVNNAFMKWAKHSFAKWRGGEFETYPEISKNSNDELRLAYVYEVSDHYQSSYTGRDEMTYERKCDYVEMLRVVRFYIGLLVPRLRTENVNEIAYLVRAAMATTFHGYDSSDWYNTYGYDCDAISLKRLTEITIEYLKERSMYREKTEFIRPSV